ncbi:hypothetical protein EDC01DRAFT_631971 [Geopyxis carbonaria]|nr:hypothetical protein EDC01DRAFT_631971 [Geopyxis carbonaria]
MTESLEHMSISSRENPSDGDGKTLDSVATVTENDDSEANLATTASSQLPSKANGTSNTSTVQLLSRSGESTPTLSETSDQSSPAIIVTGQEPFAHQLQQMLVDPVDQPDPRLMDALANPRDRLFVIRLEKDLIDFVNEKSCDVFDMPQINSYHRLLAHKMAEYYRLTHVADVTGGSVRMFRGQAARIPPTQLCDWPTSIPEQAQQKPVPGPAKSAVKIMRRTPSDKGSPRHSTTASKAGSEASSDHGDSSTSAKTSREEREAAYQEARARIFKDFVESPPETPPPGKQEKLKRQEKPDDFSGRSQFYPVMAPPVPAQSSYYPQANYADPSLHMQTGQVQPRFNPMTPNFTPPGSTYPSAGAPYVPVAASRSVPSFPNVSDRTYPVQQPMAQPLYPAQRNGPFNGQPQPMLNVNYNNNPRPQPAPMQASFSTGGFPQQASNGFLPGVMNQMNQPAVNRAQMPYQMPQQYNNQSSLSAQRIPPAFGWGGNGMLGQNAGGVSMFPRSSSAPGHQGAIDGAQMANGYGVSAQGWGQPGWNGASNMGRGAMGGMNMRM